MRNLLALFGASVLGFGGIGWYMGWYTIQVGRNADGNIHLEANVDQKKVIQDTEERAKQVESFLNTQAQKAQQSPQPSAPGNTPGPATTPRVTSSKSGSWLFGSEPAAPPTAQQPAAPATPTGGTGK